MGITQTKIQEEYVDRQYNLDQRLKRGKGYKIGGARNLLQISAGLFWFCLHVPQHFNTHPAAKSMPTPGWKLHDFLGILGVGSRKESQTTFLH
jgi:hypothetical protein